MNANVGDKRAVGGDAKEAGPKLNATDQFFATFFPDATAEFKLKISVSLSSLGGLAALLRVFEGTTRLWRFESFILLSVWFVCVDGLVRTLR